ncbi:MAG: thiol reductant ABC exporter subunit CydD [Verrucomicrobia bacterium]|nr:thiol reductant ABC exporter subunit CydD [Verrucomicrobiota bacterium]
MKGERLRTPSSTCAGRLFHLAAVSKKSLGVLGIATFVGAAAAILQMRSLSRIIDGAFLGHLDLTQLRTPFIWLSGAVCLRASALWLSELQSQEIAARVKETIRNLLFRRLLDRGPLFTLREKTGELAACSVEGVEKIDAWYAKFLPHTIALAIVPIVLATYVLWIDWPSGLVLTLTGPLILVFMALLGMMAQHKTQRQWATLSRMSGHFLDVLQGLQTLHLFGRSSVQSAQISRVSEQFRRATLQVLSIAFLSGMVLELAASISTAIVAVEIGLRLIEGLLDFRTGLFVLLLTPEFYLPFRQLGASHHAGMEGVAAGERIFELLDHERTVGTSSRLREAFVAAKPEVLLNLSVRARQSVATAACSSGIVLKSTARKQCKNRKNSDEEELVPTDWSIAFNVNNGLHVRFQNVTYQYPGTDSPALRALTFDLYPGRIHLLTGQSGAGKSTVIKLLLQFMQPATGRMVVNGESLSEISPEVWRTQVAYVSQFPHFFEGTVLDNLRIASPGVALEQVRAATRLAEADDFIMGLPHGYSTPISEAAGRFSGGERQRLAIARAFLKDSPLLLFDEPVSHLDAVTAIKLQRAFLRLARKRTTLVIAHHGFALSDADVVLELLHGQLAGATGPPGFPWPFGGQTRGEPTYSRASST